MKISDIKEVSLSSTEELDTTNTGLKNKDVFLITINNGTQYFKSYSKDDARDAYNKLKRIISSNTL